MPSPGIVTEPHFTSIAIPKPRMVQPAICTIVLMRRFSEAIHSVSIILRSMSIPKKNQSQVERVAPNQSYVSVSVFACLRRQHSSLWYIRHGAGDRDTAFSVSINLATKLQNQGKNVSFKLPWNRPHSGDYALNELFAWMAEIVKNTPVRDNKQLVKSWQSYKYFVSLQ